MKIADYSSLVCSVFQFQEQCLPPNSWRCWYTTWHKKALKLSALYVQSVSFPLIFLLHHFLLLEIVERHLTHYLLVRLHLVRFLGQICMVQRPIVASITSLRRCLQQHTSESSSHKLIPSTSSPELLLQTYWVSGLSSHLFRKIVHVICLTIVKNRCTRTFQMTLQRCEYLQGSALCAPRLFAQEQIRPARFSYQPFSLTWEMESPSQTTCLP